MRVSITFPILLMFIILPTLIISITEVNAASKLTLNEFDSENDSIDIETEDQETSDDTSSESSSDIQSEDILLTVKLTNLQYPPEILCPIFNKHPNSRIYYHVPSNL